VDAIVVLELEAFDLRLLATSLLCVGEGEMGIAWRGGCIDLHAVERWD